MEKIASPPPDQSPQTRYACLHRIVERGLASDETWAELTRVCLSLGLQDEALRAFHQIDGPTTRHAVQRLLAEKKLAPPPSEPERRKATTVDDFRRPGVLDLLSDGCHLLFQDHMPMTVISATMTFPIVVGLGGALTAGNHVLLLALLALLPGLSVLAIVGGAGRRILLEASRGLQDPPEIPDVRTLAHEAGRSARDAFALLVAFLGPAALGHLLGLPLLVTVVLAAAGMAMLPMAVATRLLTDDWRMLRPRELGGLLRRGGQGYFKLAGLIGLLFLPALATAFATLGTQLYLQVSVVGPLAVLPLFVVARMLGVYFEAHRSEYEDVIPSLQRRRQRRSRVPQSAVTGRVSPSPQAFKVGTRNGGRHAAARPATGALRQQRARDAQRKARRPAPPRPAQGHPETRSKRPPQPRPRRKQQPAPKLARQPSVDVDLSTNPKQTPEALPDLMGMPGVRVLKGEERSRAGATPRPRSR